MTRAASTMRESRADAEQWLQDARRLRAAGVSVRAIAVELGVTRGAVDYWLNRERSIAASVAWQRLHGYLPATPCKARATTDTSAGSTIEPGMPIDAPPRMVNVTFRMPAQLRDALAAVADRSGRRLSDELRALAKERVHEAFTTPKGDDA